MLTSCDRVNVFDERCKLQGERSASWIVPAGTQISSYPIEWQEHSSHLGALHRRHSNQSIPPTMAASTVYSIIGAYCFTLAHWAPSTHPKMMNAPFQTVLPRTV